MPDLRGRARGGAERQGRSRHDPDRELDRGPRRRHPSPAAARQAAHRRRALPADPLQPDGAEGRDAEDHQVGRKPHPRARAVPPLHPQARLQAGGRRRYGGRGAAHFRDDRRHARRARAEARGEDLRPEGARRERRGRGAQHDALRDPLAREEARQARQRPGRDHVRVPRAQPSGRALQGDGRLRHQRREHDQARKLHGRGQFLRHHVLRRRRGASGRRRARASRSRS